MQVLTSGRHTKFSSKLETRLSLVSTFLASRVLFRLASRRTVLYSTLLDYMSQIQAERCAPRKREEKHKIFINVDQRLFALAFCLRDDSDASTHASPVLR